MDEEKGLQVRRDTGEIALRNSGLVARGLDDLGLVSPDERRYEELFFHGQYKAILDELEGRQEFLEGEIFWFSAAAIVWAILSELRIKLRPLDGDSETAIPESHLRYLPKVLSMLTRRRIASSGNPLWSVMRLAIYRIIGDADAFEVERDLGFNLLSFPLAPYSSGEEMGDSASDVMNRLHGSFDGAVVGGKFGSTDADDLLFHLLELVFASASPIEDLRFTFAAFKSKYFERRDPTSPRASDGTYLLSDHSRLRNRVRNRPAFGFVEVLRSYTYLLPVLDRFAGGGIEIVPGKPRLPLVGENGNFSAVLRGIMEYCEGIALFAFGGEAARRIAIPPEDENYRDLALWVAFKEFPAERFLANEALDWVQKVFGPELFNSSLEFGRWMFRRSEADGYASTLPALEGFVPDFLDEVDYWDLKNLDRRKREHAETLVSLQKTLPNIDVREPYGEETRDPKNEISGVSPAVKMLYDWLVGAKSIFIEFSPNSCPVSGYPYEYGGADPVSLARYNCSLYVIWPTNAPEHQFANVDPDATFQVAGTSSGAFTPSLLGILEMLMEIGSDGEVL